MKLSVIAILSFLTSLVYSQDFERKVCNCIQTNTKSIGLNIDSINVVLEQDFLNTGILHYNYDSIVTQLLNVVEFGEISQSRTIEHILFEQAGMSTIQYCVELHTYKCKLGEISKFYELVKEVKTQDYLNEPLNIKDLKKRVANSILTYIEPSDYKSKLWKYFLINYFYLFSETEEMKAILFLEPPSSIMADTSDFITVFVSKRDSIYIENKATTVEEICSRITPEIRLKKSIFFKNEKMTNYHNYLDVYNSVSNCIHELWEIESIKLYNASFKKIDETKQIEIKKRFPFNIIESKPN